MQHDIKDGWRTTEKREFERLKVINGEEVRIWKQSSYFKVLHWHHYTNEILRQIRN
jgi:hypothetical protein